MKIQRKKIGVGGGSGVSGRGGGGRLGGVRVDVNEKLKFLGKFKKKFFFFFWGGGQGGWVRGGAGCRVGGGSGVKVDVNEELKFLVKIHKKKIFGGGSVAEGVRWGGSGWWGGVRVDVNAMLGVGVMWGTKRYCTILRK